MRIIRVEKSRTPLADLKKGKPVVSRKAYRTDATNTCVGTLLCLTQFVSIEYRYLITRSTKWLSKRGRKNQDSSFSHPFQLATKKSLLANKYTLFSICNQDTDLRSSKVNPRSFDILATIPNSMVLAARLDCSMATFIKNRDDFMSTTHVIQTEVKL